MPYVVRKICEAYPGIKPQDVYGMTWDQVYLLICEESSLKNRRIGKADPDTLRRKGVIKTTAQEGGSLFQRIMAKKHPLTTSPKQQRRAAREARRAEQQAAAAKARTEQQ